MNAREDLYARWRRQPFPPGSASDAVDELHADLALADSWIAETVIPFVEHGVHKPAHLDVVAELRALEDRAAQLGRSVSPEDSRLLQDYSQYVALLLLVYEDFLANAPSGS